MATLRCPAEDVSHNITIIIVVVIVVFSVQRMPVEKTLACPGESCPADAYLCTYDRRYKDEERCRGLFTSFIHSHIHDVCIACYVSKFVDENLKLVKVTDLYRDRTSIGTTLSHF